MKKNIHPKYNTDSIATCVCGATYNIGSTVKQIPVEICASCHPFYTGLEKILDTAGRVDRFKKRQEKSAKSTK